MGAWGGAVRARLAVLALACAAACAGEYGGGDTLYGDTAPGQYGAALDYRSPDASAPLEYKYVEDSEGNTKDITDLDTWKNSVIKRGRRRKNTSDGGAEVEAVPRAKSGRRRARPRTGPASPDSAHRRRPHRPRARDDDFTPIDYLDKGDNGVNMNKRLDEDFYTFNLEKSTERIIRRKPRDRLFSNYVKPLRNGDLESEEELISDRKLKSESTEREEMDPEEEDEAAPPARYRDDAYYYDMRRMHDVNTKLPLLLRRTTTRPPSVRGEASTATTMDLLALLLTARRRADGAPLAHSMRSPETTRVADPGPSSAPTDHETATLTTSTSPPARTSTGSTSELSIAEKSRLSILKKSQKKDSDKGEPSKKPPVLLQVTSKLPTLVMVEPPTSADPWMRARHVSGDSPQMLEKVKSLMRHKLVAGARNIQELTDNWDDVVCDYIDVSLLASAPPLRPRRTTAGTIALPLICITLALLA